MTVPARRPLLALGLMFGATVSFVAMQAVVKTAREAGLDPTQVMFLRTAPGLPLLWLVLRRRGHGLWPDQPGNVLVRSLFGSLAMGTNFTSMRWLSLAQFSTLGLSQPVFVALAAPLLLHERVRAHTWIAMALSLSGALVLLNPGESGAAVRALPAALAIASAMFGALAHIWVRKATETDPAERVVFHFAAWVSIASLIVGLARGRFMELPSGLTAPGMVLLTLGLATFGTLGQVLMTRAYVHGEAATVSTVGYASIALSMFADLVVWRHWPSAAAVVGALLMLAAALVLVRGERMRSNAARTARG